MLDPIITSHKLTIYLCVTYLENKQYPVNTTYNNRLENVTPKLVFRILSTVKMLGQILAKTLWSWGRMDDILSEGRKIESRRQLE